MAISTISSSAQMHRRLLNTVSAPIDLTPGLYTYYTFEPSTISGTTISSAYNPSTATNATNQGSSVQSTIFKSGTQACQGIDGNNTKYVLLKQTVLPVNCWTGNLSICMWYYHQISTTAQINTVLINDFLSTYFFIGRNKNGTDQNRVYVYKTNNIGTLENNAFVTCTLNQWHHIAYVKSGTTQYLYLDGVLMDTRTAIVTAGSFSTANATLLAFKNGASVLGNNGYLDNIRFYNTAITPEFITEMYNTGV